MSKKKTTWERVMACKKYDTRHGQGNEYCANNITDDELNTILATIDYFGGNVQQAYLDFRICKYRVFDALAMYCGGRLEELPTKVLVYAFLDAKGNVDKWIENLRFHDYEVEREWEGIEL